jgi:hypothetical protein
MTSNYHTPIPEGAAANAQTFNDPLGQMDEALSEALLEERDGHIIQDEGVDLAQQARLDFVGAGVTLSNEVGKTKVTIPGGVTDHGALTGLSDDDHTQYLTKDGLREWDEQGSNPSTPATNKWKLFFKSGGLYVIDDAGVVNGPLSPGTYGNLFSEDGVVLNGKISVTVATNNITVALKTLAGTDPSSLDPVYVRINNSIRSVTASLSLTLNAGTQWFALGTPFAALEQNFFVYLGWRAASSAVVIGFARIPYATLYSEFSGTSTNEKYGAFSTAPAASDNVVNIGRFAATLSAAASYNWSVPTFTTSNLIQRPIYESEWCSWLPAPTGYSAVPTSTVYRYRIVNKMVEIEIREGAAGTSNATTITMTAPFTASTLTNMQWHGHGFSQDNGATPTTTAYGAILSGSATLNLYKDPATIWTASGGKRIFALRLWYQIS